jgi:hypothetical protein
VADTLLSAIAADAAIGGAEQIYVNDAGTDKKVTIDGIREYIAITEPSNASTAAQSPAASATTYLTGSMLTLAPGSKVKVKTIVRWRVYLSKTAAGTVAIAFVVKAGTAGTTADTSAATFTFTVGTAAIDAGYVDIVWVVVGPLTNACVSTGVAHMIHQLTTTGLVTTTSPAIVSAPTIVNFDATTATKIGLAITLGASYVVTVQAVDVSSENL